MTIICWDGRYLAADSQGAEDGLRAPHVINKFILRTVNGEQRIYTGAGVARLIDAMIGWHVAGGDVTARPIASAKDDDRTCILVYSQAAGIYSLDLATPYPEEIFIGDAIGANRQYAMGLMGAGVNAIHAAKKTAERSVYSGLPIHYVDVTEHEWQIRTHDGEIVG